MAGLNDILKMDRLPAMPSALAQVLPLLMEPTTGAEALERVIRRDEAMTVAVLRLANSVQYGSPGMHFDLRRAISRLGRDALRRCILQQQVEGVVCGDNAAFGLQRGALWRSALGGAIAAEELARPQGGSEASLAFICALLRDVGKLALNVKYGAGYLEVLSSHAAGDSSFIGAERAALGFDHAQIGGALARHWKLPERIARAIETHHEPPVPGPGHDVLFDVVHAADTICRWAGLGVGVDGMEYRLADHVRSGLALDRRSAERDIALVWERLRQAEEALGERGTQGVSA